MEHLIRKIESSLHKGFIDQSKPVSAQFKPKLLTNKAHENVLSTLLQELKTCKAFTFSVAFITEGGLATLKTMLYDLDKKGIKGRILTSTFLSFNQPKMFKELLKLTNVEVRLTSVKGFHSKGYIFEHEDYYSLIVGSSNLTDSALKINFEWNVFVTSLEEGEVIHHFKNQFDDAWHEGTPLTNDWIAAYEQNYIAAPFIKSDSSNIIEMRTEYLTNTLAESLSIKPNKMQNDALQQIKALRSTGAKKGLIISATGTGKTFLSAFDVRNFQPKKMLFIVHREQILKKAMSDYRKILGGNEEDYGILSGNFKEVKARYLFATIQTISSERYLQQFERNEFDYVLIDEVHRAGAKSYQTIFNYFEPEFLLGMTATPERTDNFNIYELFDYNIAYEIRLQAALEEDMLCPFHYFGVTEFEKDGVSVDEVTELQKLVSHERVQHIIEKINYYGFSGDKVRGLMFCSSKEEARQLSDTLNDQGLKTCALTGDHSQNEREEAIKKLNSGGIEYILTVDIFNEGIDIPFLNQIVMLRQTQSSIIFIQQLGRGLRKHDSKDYVTIIDFIGNYKNNYLIPIALSGDRSMNKDNVRRRTVNTDYIQGVSTINFEEIAKKRIFEAINNTNLSTIKILKETYSELKNRLGKIPLMLDFIHQESLDPEVIVNYSDNYYSFLIKMKEELPSLTDYELKTLSMFSIELLNGKRIHEVLLIDTLLQNDSITKSEFIKLLKDFGTYVDEETIHSVENILSLNFFVTVAREKYGNKPIIILDNDYYKFNDDIVQSLKNENYKRFIEDIIGCAIEKNKQFNSTQPFTIYKKYSRKDVCRLLNWEINEEGTLNGGHVKSNTCPIFVNYHKVEDDATVHYMDEFLSNEVFKWCSTKNRKITAKDIAPIVKSYSENTTVHLFVKKHNGEGKDFYYLGNVKVDESSAINDQLVDKGKAYNVVTMNMILEHPVDYNMYHYLVEE
ncbi:DEAD/DEAH box helicase [Viridibacillus sp. YIM B01967]|uniref:DEAD/DEAH box helicase n=1 Tax=Viridibacillus soli TaxID=2798301 RepID=A0ABS1H312_9BACL|nr:DEAD/DEAH box helicase [Viridibacillus soli]MBK3493781.1 DEAD/DEAH box helicase [Viridibacillus soli]